MEFPVGGGRRGSLKQYFAGNKPAFTLSEVLITLVIIGVIAAIAVPAVSSYMQNLSLQSQFKKTYSELSQLARTFYSDNAVSVSEYAYENGLKAAVNKITSYFKEGVSLTSSGMGTANSEGVYEAYYSIKTLGGKAYSGGVNSYGKDSSFFCDNTGFKSMLSGSIFIFNDAPDENTNGPVVCVDINGQKGPNMYGRDYFLFVFTLDGGLIPMGMEHENNTQNACSSASGSCSNFFNRGSSFCSKSNNNIAYNTSCAYYALTDKHPFQSNKSYWKDFL